MDWDLDCSNIGTLTGTSKLGFWAKPNRALVSHSYALCTHQVFFSLGSCLTAEFSLEAIGGITEKPFVCRDLSHLFCFVWWILFMFFFWGWEGRIWQRWWGPTHSRRWWLSPMWRSMRQIHSLAGWLVARKARFGSFPSFLLLSRRLQLPIPICSCERSTHKLLVGDHDNLATGFRLIYLQTN